MGRQFSYNYIDCIKACLLLWQDLLNRIFRRILSLISRGDRREPAVCQAASQTVEEIYVQLDIEGISSGSAYSKRAYRYREIAEHFGLYLVMCTGSFEACDNARTDLLCPVRKKLSMWCIQILEKLLTEPGILEEIVNFNRLDSGII